MDHIIPKSHGGPNALWNLQTMCGPCNWGKSDTLDPTEMASILSFQHRAGKGVAFNHAQLGVLMKYIGGLRVQALQLMGK